MSKQQQDQSTQTDSFDGLLHLKLLQLQRREGRYCNVFLRPAGSGADGPNPKELDIGCHKIILDNRSVYFRQEFRKNRDKSLFCFENIGHATLLLLVEYMYSAGEINLTPANVVNVYNGAKELKLETLEIKCLNSFEELMSIQNVVEMLTIARSKGNMFTFELTVEFILNRLEELKEGGSVLELMDFVVIQDIIQHKYVQRNFPTEGLFKLALAWLGIGDHHQHSWSVLEKIKFTEFSRPTLNKILDQNRNFLTETKYQELKIKIDAVLQLQRISLVETITIEPDDPVDQEKSRQAAGKQLKNCQSAGSSTVTIKIEKEEYSDIPPGKLSDLPVSLVSSVSIGKGGQLGPSEIIPDGLTPEARSILEILDDCYLMCASQNEARSRNHANSQLTIQLRQQNEQPTNKQASQVNELQEIETELQGKIGNLSDQYERRHSWEEHEKCKEQGRNLPDQIIKQPEHANQAGKHRHPEKSRHQSEKSRQPPEKSRHNSEKYKNPSEMHKIESDKSKSESENQSSKRKNESDKHKSHSDKRRDHGEKNKNYCSPQQRKLSAEEMNKKTARQPYYYNRQSRGKIRDDSSDSDWEEPSLKKRRDGALAWVSPCRSTSSISSMSSNVTLVVEEGEIIGDPIVRHPRFQNPTILVCVPGRNFGVIRSMDMDTKVISIIGDCPNFDCGYNMLYYNDKLYFTGGWDEDLDSRGKPSNVCAKMFDLTTKTWHLLPPISLHRVDFKSVILGHHLYTIGGRSDCGAYIFGNVQRMNVSGVPESLYHLSITEGSSVEFLKYPRYQFGVGVLRNRIYVIGGYRALHSGKISVCGKVEAYDPTTNVWEEKSSLAAARVGLAVVACNSRLFALGGSYSNHHSAMTNLVDMYDPVSDTWTFMKRMKKKRKCFSAVVRDNNYIYAIGGDSKECPTVERFDMSKNKWELLGNILLADGCYESLAFLP